MRVHATGPLALADISRHLAACDLMLQPYAEGVSTCHTSLMATLAHHRPVMTTAGALTEPLWSKNGAVALVACDDKTAMGTTITRLMGDAGERARLGTAGGALYAERFDVTHTIAALREAC
jgi:hypothetical protein